jgi:hypothetical protein
MGSSGQDIKIELNTLKPYVIRKPKITDKAQSAHNQSKADRNAMIHAFIDEHLHYLGV